MTEFSSGKEKLVRENEPIVFENKTDSSFDVSMGVVFHKSGIYEVSILGNRTVVSKVTERKKGKWIDAYPDIEPNPMFMYGICSVCGCEQAISDKLNFCPDCGADMRGEEDV